MDARSPLGEEESAAGKRGKDYAKAKEKATAIKEEACAAVMEQRSDTEVQIKLRGKAWL